MTPSQPILVLLAVVCSSNMLFGQAEVEPRTAPDAKVLNAEQWKQLDGSVQKGLHWLATQQKEDGSFESKDPAQPAVTSFCLMAFLAQGENPVETVSTFSFRVVGFVSGGSSLGSLCETGGVTLRRVNIEGLDRLY